MIDNMNMDYQDNSDIKDVSDKFAVVWDSYKKSRYFIFALWALLFFLFVAAHYNFITFNRGWVGMATVITIVWIIYSYFALKCPNCHNFIGGFVDILWYKCPQCGAVLFKRSSKNLEKAKLISVILIILIFMLILAAIFKGATIEHRAV